MAMIAALLSTVIWAQLRPNEEGGIVMDTVRTVEGVPDTILYERAKEWMLRNMKSSDNQVSLDDEAKEKLIGTTNLLLPNKQWNAFSYSTERILNFKLSLFVKNGRYRSIIENIIYSEVVVNQHIADTQVERRPGMISMEELFKKKAKPRSNGKPTKLNKFDVTIAEFEGVIKNQLSSLNNAMIGNRDTKESDW